MAIFGKNKVSCPVCGEPLTKGKSIKLHNLQHAIPSADGRGFDWRCGCGAHDGTWPGESGAAVGLTNHFLAVHGISD